MMHWNIYIYLFHSISKVKISARWEEGEAKKVPIKWFYRDFWSGENRLKAVSTIEIIKLKKVYRVKFFKQLKSRCQKYWNKDNSIKNSLCIFKRTMIITYFFNFIYLP